MLEEIWQHTETVLAILAFVGIVAVGLGTLYCMILWICDILKLGKSSRVPFMYTRKPTPPPKKPRQHYRLPSIERVPRKHKPGHRRSARMDYDELGENPCASILDSTCPGGRDDS